MQAPVAQSLIVATQSETDPAALVWDRASSRQDASVRAMGLPLIEQPPYSPGPGTPWVPVQRIFEELRAGTEGRVYATIEEKVAAVEGTLEELDADAERVKSLASRDWIVDNLDRLPGRNAA